MRMYVVGVKEDSRQLVSAQHKQVDIAILNWLTPINFGPQQSDYLSQRQKGTASWFLDSDKFQDWLRDDNQTLFCPGIPGAGKTVLTSIVVANIDSKFGDDPNIGIAYIYFNYKRRGEQTVEGLFGSLIKQLAVSQSSLPRAVQELYDRHHTKETRPSVGELIGTLQSVTAMHSRVFIMIDALDECQSSDYRRSRFVSEMFILQAKTRMNLFATSRFIKEIEEMFQNVPKVEIRASDEDIRRYLSDNMPQLPGFVRDFNLQEQITTAVLQAVQGM